MPRPLGSINRGFVQMQRFSLVILVGALVATCSPGLSSAELQSGESWWSFQPLRHPDIPEVSNSSWPRNAIDHFVMSRLEREQIEPSLVADRATLIRRLSLDLRGLPPNPDEVSRFVIQERPPKPRRRP